MTEQDERFMRLAAARAREGVDKGQSPFGACIVKNGELIACEHNLVLQNTDITAHAEILAIRMACRELNNIDLSGSIIYSTCEPCPMCFTACHWARINKIIYGAEIDDAKRFGFNELTVSNRLLKELGKSGLEIIHGFMRKECVELFEYWAGKTDRRVY
jgi:tRNA(Arg) A34 adenosine deaminase TadA